MFHHCGLEPNDTIVNYKNAKEVWTCDLGGLAEYGSRFFTVLTFSFHVDHAPAWQQKRNMFASGLQLIRMISYLWGSMVYAWMRLSVRPRNLSQN